jgi:hypothetical protein
MITLPSLTPFAWAEIRGLFFYRLIFSGFYKLYNSIRCIAVSQKGRFFGKITKYGRLYSFGNNSGDI